MYGTLNAANSYHTTRNNTAWSDAAAPGDSVRTGALQRATDYINATYRKRFPGVKTGGRAQVDEWPRDGAIDADGFPITDGTVPIEVEYATYEAALLIVKGIDLNPVVQGGAVKRERVKAGPVESETEYSDEVEAYSSFAIIDNLLSAVLRNASGAQLDLLRA